MPDRWNPDGPEPCHRCGTIEGVAERFVVTNPTPCLAGVQRKVTGYITYGCDSCWAEFTEARSRAS